MNTFVETKTSIEKPRRPERLLLIVMCEDRIVRADLRAGEVITVGRCHESALRIDHLSVSRAHVRIYGGRPVTVEDLESRNGTRLHGARIGPGQRVPLRPGDMLQCGEALIFLQRVPAEQPGSDRGSHGSLSAPPKELVLAADQCSFETAPGSRVELGRRGPLRRVLLALVERRLHHPGVALNVDALANAGWPGERIHYESAVARVYTTINRLRALGLQKVLLTHDDGYLLDPALPVREGK